MEEKEIMKHCIYFTISVLRVGGSPTTASPFLSLQRQTSSEFRTPPRMKGRGQSILPKTHVAPWTLIIAFSYVKGTEVIPEVSWYLQGDSGLRCQFESLIGY